MSDIYRNLLELTKGSFFYKIENLKDIVANTEDFIDCLDLTDCVGFGTHNGQEMLIYNTNEGRRHIKYSAMFTRFFGKIVLQNIYSDAGKVFEFDFSKTFDRMEELEKDKKKKIVNQK